MKPLVIERVDDELIIRIGIDTLIYATIESNIDGIFDDIVVTDRDELIKDVVRELEKEDEEGTTPVHTLLDKVVLAAVDSGSLGIDVEGS